jgi:hypothetical protein
MSDRFAVVGSGQNPEKKSRVSFESFNSLLTVYERAQELAGTGRGRGEVILDVP